MLAQNIDYALSLIERFQSLIAGAAAIFAAFIGARALYRVSRAERKNFVEATARAFLSEIKCNEWYFNYLSNLIKKDPFDRVFYDNEITNPRRIIFKSNSHNIGVLGKQAIFCILDFYTILDQAEEAKNDFLRARREMEKLSANEQRPADLLEELDIAHQGLDGVVEVGREKLAATEQALEAVLKKRF